MIIHRGNEAQAGKEESVEKKNQLLHRKTVKMVMMMMMMMKMIVVTVTVKKTPIQD